MILRFLSPNIPQNFRTIIRMVFLRSRVTPRQTHRHTSLNHKISHNCVNQFKPFKPPFRMYSVVSLKTTTTSSIFSEMLPFPVSNNHVSFRTTFWHILAIFKKNNTQMDFSLKVRKTDKNCPIFLSSQRSCF